MSRICNYCVEKYFNPKELDTMHGHCGIDEYATGQVIKSIRLDMMLLEDEERKKDLKVKLLSDFAKIPTKADPDAAGFDLYASESAILEPGIQQLVHTHIAVCTPKGTYGRVAPRSGLAYKNNIFINAGVIDSNYTGEVGVIMVNFSKTPFEVKRGDRIAQLILEQYSNAKIVEVKDLSQTVRGEGGFGSSGK